MGSWRSGKVEKEFHSRKKGSDCFSRVAAIKVVVLESKTASY